MEQTYRIVPIFNAGGKRYGWNLQYRSGRRPLCELYSATGMAWIRFIPGFLLRTFVRLASRSITMQKRFGVVAVTSVGMFGSGALWLVPLTSATVTVAVGSITKRPALIDGELQECEHLCLTLSFNHDIIDGAPAARFTRRFAALLAGGDELYTLIDDAATVPRNKETIQ